MRVPVSIAVGLTLLIGLVAIPATAQVPQVQVPETPELPDQAETPEVPETPELADLGGFEEVLACLTGEGLVPELPGLSDLDVAQVPGAEAGLGIILCVYEQTVALLNESIAAVLETLRADLPGQTAQPTG